MSYKGVVTTFGTSSTAELVAALTTDEKVSLLSGRDVWRTVSVPRLGIPSIKVTDGPNGARGDSTTGALSVCLPAPIAMAASFDRALVSELGQLLGRETARKAAHVVLAPTINMARHPLGGRNFESFGEEPLLTAALASAYVEGVQREGVGACAKHFVANDTEDGRLTVSSEVDEQTLREVLLAPFEAVVDTGVWTVMAAYPKLNGTYCTEHRWLLTSVLRDDWGFDGLVMSDWSATHDPGAVTAGLDLEMPGPTQALGDRARAAVANGELAEADLDRAAGAVVELARRAMAAGVVGPADGDTTTGVSEDERSADEPEERALVRNAAADGMVLLTNHQVTNGDTEVSAPLLPLDSALTSVAVIGPNADPGVIHGGGSAQLLPHYRVSPVDGLRAALPQAHITVWPGCRADRYVPPVDRSSWIDDGVADGPLRTEVFADPELDGEPIEIGRATSIAAFFHGKRQNMPNVAVWSQRWTGRMRITTNGRHRFGVLAVGRSRVLVDGVLIADNWTDPKPGQAFFEKATEEVVGEVELTAGTDVEVIVEWSSGDDLDLAGLRFGHQPPADDDGLLTEAEHAAKAATVAVVVVGLTAEWETESHDRVMFGLPGRQDELVRRVVAVNPRTVVVVNAGAPVDLPWLDDVPATVMAWYPGQEFGNALADVLLGHRDPGGRLPVTFPVELADGPTAELVPGDGQHLHYSEGNLIGHRWYDHHRIRPRLAFGHGLSYATFEFGIPSATRQPEGPGAVAIPVRCGDDREGKCVIQVYLRPEGAERPRVLAGFTAVELAAGEERIVAVDLLPQAFREWDVDRGWQPLVGTHELQVATAADAVVHRFPCTIGPDGAVVSVSEVRPDDRSR